MYKLNVSQNVRWSVKFYKIGKSHWHTLVKGQQPPKRSFSDWTRVYYFQIENVFSPLDWILAELKTCRAETCRTGNLSHWKLSDWKLVGLIGGPQTSQPLKRWLSWNLAYEIFWPWEFSDGLRHLVPNWKVCRLLYFSQRNHANYEDVTGRHCVNTLVQHLHATHCATMQNNCYVLFLCSANFTWSAQWHLVFYVFCLQTWTAHLT